LLFNAATNAFASSEFIFMPSRGIASLIGYSLA
jgi:hypothetical protein